MTLDEARAFLGRYMCSAHKLREGDCATCDMVTAAMRVLVAEGARRGLTAWPALVDSVVAVAEADAIAREVVP